MLNGSVTYKDVFEWTRSAFACMSTHNLYVLVDNTNSLGLFKNDKLPFDVSKSPSQSVIADIIMQPAETELLKQAKTLGRSVHYGKYMIEHQIDLVGNFLDLW